MDCHFPVSSSRYLISVTSGTLWIVVFSTALELVALIGAVSAEISDVDSHPVPGRFSQ